MSSVDKFAAEFIGSMILMSTILMSGKPFTVAAGIAAALIIAVPVSGGHLNPAVSTVFLATKQLEATDYFGYVIAQIAGMLVAWWFYQYFWKKNVATASPLDALTNGDDL